MTRKGCLSASWHTAGDAALDQRARDYLVDFAIPNLWFHLTMAYAALRAARVAIGKADFDGLYAYRRGFHFVWHHLRWQFFAVSDCKLRVFHTSAVSCWQEA